MFCCLLSHRCICKIVQSCCCVLEFRICLFVSNNYISPPFFILSQICLIIMSVRGPVAQSVASLIADHELDTAQSHTFSRSFSSFHLFKKGWFQKRKYLHNVLVNCLVKLALEKSG